MVNKGLIICVLVLTQYTNVTDRHTVTTQETQNHSITSLMSYYATTNTAT